MSMMSMLGKVAMGMVVAKVTKSMMGGTSSGGGIGDMLGGLLGGNKNGSNTSTSQSGGIGDLLSGLTGGSSSKATPNNDNDLGGLLSAALSGEEVGATTPTQEEQAKVLLKAMINAAKADGKIDQEEQAKIVEHIGEITPEELAFVKSEMSAPLDIEGIIEQAKGIEAEVYLSSLMTINLDSKEEALYLDKLAKGLNISKESTDAFHEKLGVPKLYS